MLAFADPRVGWLVEGRSGSGGGTAYVTRDAGAHWRRLALHAVTALATSGAAVYFVAANTVYIGSTSSDVVSAIAPSAGDGLFVDASTVYNYADNAGLAATPTMQKIIGHATTSISLPSGCRRTYSAALTRAPAGQLILVCGSAPGAGNQDKTAYGSSDDGVTWHPLAPPRLGGYVSLGAAGTAGAFVTGGRMELDATYDGGRTWATAITGSSTAGGFYDVGFFGRQYGWAVDGGPPAALYLSDDGGRTWHTAASPQHP